MMNTAQCTILTLHFCNKTITTKPFTTKCRTLFSYSTNPLILFDSHLFAQKKKRNFFFLFIQKRILHSHPYDIEQNWNSSQSQIKNQLIMKFIEEKLFSITMCTLRVFLSVFFFFFLNLYRNFFFLSLSFFSFNGNPNVYYTLLLHYILTISFLKKQQQKQHQCEAAAFYSCQNAMMWCEYVF